MGLCATPSPGLHLSGGRLLGHTRTVRRCCDTGPGQLLPERGRPPSQLGLGGDRCQRQTPYRECDRTVGAVVGRVPELVPSGPTVLTCPVPAVGGEEVQVEHELAMAPVVASTSAWIR